MVENALAVPAGGSPTTRALSHGQGAGACRRSRGAGLCWVRFDRSILMPLEFQQALKLGNDR
jgi:hypothetical protein